jgi:hypothetical protein
VYEAKKTPVHRAHSWGVFRDTLMDLTEKTVDADIRLREDMQMQLKDDFEVPSDDLTEEELAELHAQKNIRRQENIKKNKKKAKTEEEEAAECAELKNKVADIVS